MKRVITPPLSEPSPILPAVTDREARLRCERECRRRPFARTAALTSCWPTASPHPATREDLYLATGERSLITMERWP